MVHTNEANKRNYRTYQQNKFNSTRLISKYQKKQDKRFKYILKIARLVLILIRDVSSLGFARMRMRLPSIEDCLGCSDAMQYTKVVLIDRIVKD